MMHEEKKRIRDVVLRRRGQFFTKHDPHQASEVIIKRLKEESAYQSAKTILCFVSFGTEVQTHQFIRDALTAGKRIFVPYIPSKKEGMKTSELKDFAELETGYFNILTPKVQFLRLTEEEPDLVIVPGVAFSRNGYRIGYGGGFYDRYLADKPNTTRIGIAFQVQVVNEVPIDIHDIPVEMLITEEATLSFPES